MMITRQYISHILEPNMTTATDRPALWRRASSLLVTVLIRLLWLATWLIVIMGAIATLGTICRIIFDAFRTGWSLFGLGS